MHAEIATLDWPAEALFDSEEQDEPLAGQDHRDIIDSLSYPLRGRLADPGCYVAAELRVHRDPHDLHDYKEPDILVALVWQMRCARTTTSGSRGKLPIW